MGHQAISSLLDITTNERLIGQQLLKPKFEPKRQLVKGTKNVLLSDLFKSYSDFILQILISFEVKPTNDFFI
jgi:hypothetical protein